MSEYICIKTVKWDLAAGCAVPSYHCSLDSLIATNCPSVLSDRERQFRWRRRKTWGFLLFFDLPAECWGNKKRREHRQQKGHKLTRQLVCASAWRLVLNRYWGTWLLCKSQECYRTKRTLVQFCLPEWTNVRPTVAHNFWRLFKHFILLFQLPVHID